MIRTGELPATRVGNRWFVDENALSRIGQSNSPQGRRFGQHLSWSLLADLEGREQMIPLHRQERVRLSRYRLQPHEILCQRLRGRARFIPLSTSSTLILRIHEDERWTFGGSEAAARFAHFDGASGMTTVYARKSLEEDFYDSSLAVIDRELPNLFLALVDDEYWPSNWDLDRYAWSSVAYLDCLEQRIWTPALERLWPRVADNLEVSKVVSDLPSTDGEDTRT